MDERACAYTAQGFAGERSSYEEERESDEVLSKLVDGSTECAAYAGYAVAEERSVAEDVGLEEDGNDKPDNESWDT